MAPPRGSDAGEAGVGGSGARAGEPASRRPLIDRLDVWLDRHSDLLPEGAAVLVAFSGGPDSTALLDLLRRLSPERGFRVLAAHFDHGIRPESAIQAGTVAGRAAELGVVCAIGRPPAPLEPTQAELRRARYAFLRAEARRAGAERVATGHHADDQAETVLFRLLRGTGLRGLGGIPLRRGAFVRPLLPFRAGEIRAYLHGRGLAWLDDPSNRDPRWTRPRIRHEVLPLLDDVAGGSVVPRLVALAARARRAEAALEASAAEALRRAREAATRAREPGSAPDLEARTRIARSEVLGYHAEIQARMVRKLARARGVELSRGGTRAAVQFIKRGRSGGAVDVAEGLQLGREFDTLWFGPPPRSEPDEILEIPDAGPGRREVAVGGRTYRVAWTAHGTAGEGDERGWEAELPLRALRFPLRLRGPRPGDRLWDGEGGRKLKALFLERRVPASRRARIPVLEDARGRVVWVAGVGAARFPRGERNSDERFVLEVRHAGGRSAGDREERR